MDALDRLLEHDQWATAQLLEVAHGLSDAQLDREFDVGHHTVRATFEHMISNGNGWTAALAGQEPASVSTSVDALAERHARASPVFADIARRLRDGQRLQETFTDPFGQPMTFGGAIITVILHNEDHRTEILHISSRLGLPEVGHGLWDCKRR
ncbi:MAG TPA: DinB family protein, partial [Thermomicrobiales bacterium]|nr:DinB family protein [Thermomicrobiales bacterium]